MGCNGQGPWGRRLASIGLCALAWSGAALADDAAAPATRGAGNAAEQRSAPSAPELDRVSASRCPAPQVAAAATTEQEVAELYRQFECRFLDQQYAAGLPYLERACALKNSPACLLNLAAVHHGLMHCELARSYYFRYLDVVPYDEASESVQHALDELASSCGSVSGAQGGVGVEVEGEPAAQPRSDRPAPPAASSIAALPAAAPEPSPPRSSAGTSVTARAALPQPVADQGGSTERQVSLWLLSAGAASGVGAVIALLYGARVEHDAERRDRVNGELGTSNDPELDAIDRAGRRSNQLSALLGIGSGLLVGAGATLWIMNPGSGASINLDADGAASLGYAGVF